jgi:hypothetical protein
MLKAYTANGVGVGRKSRQPAGLTRGATSSAISAQPLHCGNL